jgi:hypothetical protein
MPKSGKPDFGAMLLKDEAGVWSPLQHASSVRREASLDEQIDSN